MKVVSLLLVAFLFTSVYGSCLYSATECKCKREVPGNFCLQYREGVAGLEKCTSYECGSGYVCDCTGMEICEIGACKANSTIYQPTEDLLTRSGQIVSCRTMQKEKCIAPRNPSACVNVKSPVINELRPNPPGANPTVIMFEIRGEPETSFSGVVSTIKSSQSTSSGIISDVKTVSGSFDDNGLLIVNINDISPTTFTIVLSSAAPGLPRSVLDSDGDSIIDDASVFGHVYDAIAVPGSVGDENRMYGANLGGTDFKYIGGVPSLLFRDSCTGELYAANSGGNAIVDTNADVLSLIDFNVPNALQSTFGMTNPTMRSS